MEVPAAAKRLEGKQPSETHGIPRIPSPTGRTHTSGWDSVTDWDWDWIGRHRLCGHFVF